MQAADVLIDDTTVSAAAKAIAHSLTDDDEVLVCFNMQHPHKWRMDQVVHVAPFTSPLYLQALLESFTPTRTMQVLRSAPVTLSRMLRALPPALHPLIIESQIESASLLIDTELLPPFCRPPPGLSTLTFLTSLSLPSTDAAACDPVLLAAALEPLTTLVHLNLKDTSLTAANAPILASAISGLTGLQHLDVSSNMILRSGVEAMIPSLGMLTNMTFLSLATNCIMRARAAILSILGTLKNLKILDLSSNSALRRDKSSEVAERQRNNMPEPDSFGPLPPLQELLLDSEGLDSIDVASCVAPLLQRVAPTLTRLHLSDNSIMFAAEALCSAMAIMPHLCDLDVRGCGFTVADVLSMLENLAAARASEVSEGIADENAALRLQSLSFGELDPRPSDSEADMALRMGRVFSRCTALQHLDITCLDIALHPDILPIQHLIGLTGLDISQNTLTGEFAESLTALQQLVCLRAAMVDGAHGAGFMAALALFTALTELDLSENGIEDYASLSVALRELTALQKLDLGTNNLLASGTDLPAALEGLSSLQSLSLTCNDVVEATAAQLARSLATLTGLTEMVLDTMCQKEGAARALGACLPSLTGLVSLALDENKLPESAQPLVASIVQRMRCLRELDLAGMGFKGRHMELVAKTIADLPRLSVLSVGGNSLPAAAASALGKAVAELDLLRELDLQGSSLGHRGLTALAPWIGQLKVLQAVNLGEIGTHEDKPIPGHGWSAVCAALATLPGLRELELKGNMFTRTVVVSYIAPHLSQMTALQVLDVGDCSMNANTITAWMDAIAPLTGLNSLDIAGNTLPAKIGEMIARLPLLEDVSLRDCGLSDNDLHVLCDGLSLLDGLRMVTLSMNDVSHEAVSNAADVLPHAVIEFEQDFSDHDVVSVDESDNDDSDASANGSGSSVESE